MYGFLLLALGLNTKIFPPVGRQYGKIISIPVFGTQKIYSKIVSANTVDIYLKGIINLNGTAKYFNNDDREIVVLSYNLRRTLNTFNIDFNLPEYDSLRDRVTFRLKIRPIFYNKKIVLDRVYECIID